MSISISIASPADLGVSGCYRTENGDLEPWVRARIDGAVDGWQPLRLTFDDETDHYARASAAARAHIQAKGYFRVYEFWYDGCNYGGEDFLKGRPIQEGRRPGTCWQSGVWQFDETAVVEEQEVGACGAAAEEPEADAGAAAAPEPDCCVVCLEGHPETLLVPCGHSVACRACSEGLASSINAHRCVVCRAAIERILVDWE